MARIARFLARWIMVLMLSVLMAAPLVVVATEIGTTISMERLYERQGSRPPPGEKDLGGGLAGLSYMIVYSLGSTVVVWPFTIWGACAIVRRLEKAWFPAP